MLSFCLINRLFALVQSCRSTSAVSTGAIDVPLKAAATTTFANMAMKAGPRLMQPNVPIVRGKGGRGDGKIGWGGGYTSGGYTSGGYTSGGGYKSNGGRSRDNRRKEGGGGGSNRKSSNVSDEFGASDAAPLVRKVMDCLMQNLVQLSGGGGGGSTEGAGYEDEFNVARVLGSTVHALTFLLQEDASLYQAHVLLLLRSCALLSRYTLSAPSVDDGAYGGGASDGTVFFLNDFSLLMYIFSVPS